MTNLKYIVGVDPGLSGAIAYLREDGHLTVLGMPTKKQKNKTVIDEERLLTRFDRTGVISVTVEEQSTRQRQKGVKTGMVNFGILLGIVLANYHKLFRVTPQVWKKALNCPADKNQSRARASELMPRAAHIWASSSQDGLAEAAMIAFYAATKDNPDFPEIFTVAS